MGVGRRVQNGKVVDPGSSSISCGQDKSLSHSQFPQLYNELLGPFWLPCAAFCDWVLTGDTCALCGGNAEKGQCGEKADGTSSVTPWRS